MPLRVAYVTTAARGVAPGISVAVEGMAAVACQDPSCGVTVVAVLPRQDAGPPSGDGPLSRTRVPMVGPRIASYAPGLSKYLRGERPDIVHQHGVWQFTGLAAADFCRCEGIPLVVSPHGMLSKAAMAGHSVRKRMAWLTYQRAVLAAADVIHVTSEGEMLDVRSMGIRTPAAVIALGVQTPATCPPERRNSSLRAVFLGRLDPLKGVGDLVTAWATVRPEGWKLTLAGPDNVGYAARLRRLISQAALENVVEIPGPLWGADRDALLAAADLLILPSHTENFGLVVAEALAQGVPVVTTTATPWECVAEAGCGWVVPSGVEGISAGLAAACAIDRATLRGMGQLGWQFAHDRLKWDVVGRHLADVYRWLVRGGAIPSCIRLA